MTDQDNPIDEISRIEAQLEELAGISERCRKIILVSKVAIAAGVALLLFTMLGLFGSNISTLQQTMAAMSAAEALRSDLISRIDLRLVGDRKL